MPKFGEMPDANAGQAPENTVENESKIKPVDAIMVHVSSAQSEKDVLSSYPGYVSYDKTKHDLDRSKVREERMSQGVTDFAYTIVKE